MTLRKLKPVALSMNLPGLDPACCLCGGVTGHINKNVEGLKVTGPRAAAASSYHKLINGVYQDWINHVACSIEGFKRKSHIKGLKVNDPRANVASEHSYNHYFTLDQVRIHIWIWNKVASGMKTS